MIPGVLMQGHKAGRSLSVVVNVRQSQFASFRSQPPPVSRFLNISQPSAVSLGRLYAKGKAITVASAESISINRSFARPKAIAFAIGESASVLTKKGHTAFVGIAQAISYVRNRLPGNVNISSPLVVHMDTKGLVKRSAAEYDGMTVFYENEVKPTPFASLGTAQTNPANSAPS